MRLKKGTIVRLRPDCDPFNLGLGIVLTYEPDGYSIPNYCWVQFLNFPDSPKWCDTKNLIIISEAK